MATGDERASRLAEEYSGALAEAISGGVALLTRAQRIYLDSIASMRTGSPAPDAATLWTRWLEFGIRSYGQYVAASLQYWNRFAGGVEETMRASDRLTQPSSPTATRSVAMRIAASRGDTATASFLVENNLSRPIDVAFNQSPFTTDSGTIVPATLRMEPDHAHLESGSEAIVKAVVDVSDVFEAGKAYTSIVTIAGLPGREVRIVLDVLP